MELYLVRHAAAFGRDPDRWPKDSERPLTPEGEEEFRLAARGLARMVPRADVILSSPARRAWRTAEILSELDSWPAPEPLLVVAASPRRASPEKATLALGDYADAESVAVVGHRPGLHERGLHLLRRRPCAVELRWPAFQPISLSLHSRKQGNAKIVSGQGGTASAM